MNENDEFLVPKKLMEPIPNYDAEKVLRFMQAVSKSRGALFLEKDEAYGGSWQKDGLFAAFFNLKRKTDRFESLFKSGKLFDSTDVNSGDTNMDTVLDMINYAEMFLVYQFFKSNKEQFKQFVEFCPELGELFVINKAGKVNEKSS